MARFASLKPDRPVPAADEKILSAEDWALHRSAAEVLSAANAKAEEIAEAARAAYEAEKERGYADGMATAQEAIAEQMLTMVSRSVDYLATAEGEVAKTVMVCLRRILGESPEEDLVIKAARTALDVVRNESRVTMAVRPEIREQVQQRIGEVLSGNGSLVMLEVVSDPGLAAGGCRLETDLGIVDASIDAQIAAIEKALKSRVQQPL